MEQLISYLLPKGILDYFTITKVNALSDSKLTVVLEEKNIKPEELKDRDLESKGFQPIIKIRDFPIRERSVCLHIKRRRWRDKQTGESFSKDWQLTANGSKYTKEFADFLKEYYRYEASKY